MRRNKLARATAGIIERALGTGVRTSDVFLVGYPKSGMTWMEFLLAHALFEKRAGDWVTFRTINDYIPNLASIGSRDPLLLWSYMWRPEPRVFFTHTPFDSRLTRGRIIYMLRDPRDALVSYYHFTKRERLDFKLTLREFLKSDDFYPCHWDDHVRGWVLDNHKAPFEMLVVNYEELRRDTTAVLARVLGFLDISTSNADLDRIIEMSSFERMRRIEIDYPTGIKADPNERFVRKGRVGGWRDELTEADASLIEARYGEVMRKKGYL